MLQDTAESDPNHIVDIDHGARARCIMASQVHAHVVAPRICVDVQPSSIAALLRLANMWLELPGPLPSSQWPETQVMGVAAPLSLLLECNLQCRMRGSMQPSVSMFDLHLGGIQLFIASALSNIVGSGFLSVTTDWLRLDDSSAPRSQCCAYRAAGATVHGLVLPALHFVQVAR